MTVGGKFLPVPEGRKYLPPVAGKRRKSFKKLLKPMIS